MQIIITKGKKRKKKGMEASLTMENYIKEKSGKKNQNFIKRVI